jgi:hypothetical protein
LRCTSDSHTRCQLRSESLGRARLDGVKRDFFARLPAHRAPLGAAHRIDADNYAVNRGALSRMRGRGIAIIDAPELREIDGKLSPSVKPELDLIGAELSCLGECAISDLVALS